MNKILVVIIVFISFGAGFLIGAIINKKDQSISFYGYITQKLDGMVIVKGIPENDINHRGKFSIEAANIKNKKKIVDTSNKTIDLSEISLGSLVRITYRGEVLEISPAIIQHVLGVEIIEEGVANKYYNENPEYIEYCLDYPTHEEVTMTLSQNVYDTSINEVSVKWKNNAENNLTFGDFFALQIKIDGQWKSVIQNDDMAFETIGYDLQPGSELEHTYPIKEYFGQLENGEYRIVTYFLDTATAGIYVEYLLTGEFLVQ